MARHETPLLTIAIPTFNRAAILKQTIEHLLALSGDLFSSGQVQVLICDNHSSDETPCVLQEIESEYPEILTTFNLTTLPVFESVCRLTAKSTADYIWVFGDDDMLSDGFIYDLFDVLRTENPEFLVFSRLDFTNESNIDRSPQDMRYAVRDDSAVRSRPVYYDRLFSFISGNVYRRSLFEAKLDIYRNYVQNNYLAKLISWDMSLSGPFLEFPKTRVFKRCSIGSGSHFQRDYSIQKKTFVRDRFEVAQLIEPLDQGVARALARRALNRPFFFMRLKLLGDDLGALGRELEDLGADQTQLLILGFVKLLPIWACRLLGGR